LEYYEWKDKRKPPLFGSGQKRKAIVKGKEVKKVTPKRNIDYYTPSPPRGGKAGNIFPERGGGKKAKRGGVFDVTHRKKQAPPKWEPGRGLSDKNGSGERNMGCLYLVPVRHKKIPSIHKGAIREKKARGKGPSVLAVWGGENGTKRRSLAWGEGKYQQSMSKTTGGEGTRS